MNLRGLKKIIQSRDIKDVRIDVKLASACDFSGCKISNVQFYSKKGSDAPTLSNANFENATLEAVSFEAITLEFCNFDNKLSDKHSLKQVSFKRAKINNCRFRNAYIIWSDFRYSEISHGTFESSKIDYCDFYRAFFSGIIMFKHSKISNTSLFNCYFGDGANIRRSNLLNDKIIQEDATNYKKFIKDWSLLGTEERTNDNNKISYWNLQEAVNKRCADAEDIYKTLNGLWSGKGYIADSNWAYTKGRKNELFRMKSELCQGNISVWTRISTLKSIIQNFTSWVMFGYGESIYKIIGTYFATIFLFAYLFYDQNLVNDFGTAFYVSLKNMVGVSSENVVTTAFTDFLNVIQTTAGIVLTGIFGFVIGNKIRNQ